ncbi:MAG: SAVED domain-containing protein [Candidatus Acidiferrales bacterium]
MLRGQEPIDTDTCEGAIAPDSLKARMASLVIDPAAGWPRVSREIRGAVRSLFSAGDSYGKRFAVFPLAPVSACIALGYFLTSRPTIRLFQFHRDVHSWRWPTRQPERCPALTVDFGRRKRTPEHVAFLFSLSSQIDPKRVAAMLPPGLQVVSIGVPHPTTGWLRNPRQIDAIAESARASFEEALTRWPGTKMWRIFYAGPAPGAVVVGQQLNPTMSPDVQLYEFNHPNHVPSLVLSPRL